MNAVEIFKQLIGNRIKPMIIEYKPYKDEFNTYSYRHILDADFEVRFADVIFDSMIFYAYEKDEIEKEYQKGHLNDLRRSSRIAYSRVPKTEKETDGLLGELTLDAFLKLFFPNIEMLYSRAKYMEQYPHKEEIIEQNGHEIKGYDGMIFSVENERKYFWVGQVKTGTWDYCLKAIKDDINKSIIKFYFGDAIAILCDIMRAVNSVSPELSRIIDDINDIIYSCNNKREIKIQGILDYFKQEGIKVKIPCLLMPDESQYEDSEKLLEIIKNKISAAFKGFRLINDDNIEVEILILVFPLRDLQKVRKLFLEVRKA